MRLLVNRLLIRRIRSGQIDSDRRFLDNKYLCIQLNVYTSIMTMKHSLLPALPCMCASFRRTSRALTQFYEDALRPVGLRSTQFTILQALSLAGEVTQRRLGEILAMDSTTLTRTLSIMRREGWISERCGEDRRERRLRLAKAGEAQFKRALPVWEKVQSRLRHRLGEQAWKNLFEITHQVTDLVTTQGDSL